MSHTVQVKNIECKNEQALMAACENLKIKVDGRATHKLFSSNTAVGHAVHLPGWKYPVVIDTETGTARYDNYNGSWGQQIELDRLMQRYTVECARQEASRAGYGVQETSLENGDLRLSLIKY